MRTHGSIRTWALAGALALGSPLARAEDAPKPYPPCDRTPTETETGAAKGAFEAGNASYNEADYERAVFFWEDAYRRDCSANRLLLNLARVYESNGQKRHAVNALETFLARSPGSSEESQLKRRLEKLQEQIRAEGAAPPPPAPAPGPAPQPVPVAGPPPEPPPDDSSTGKRSIVPLIVAGGGGVVAIIGTTVWLKARSDEDAAAEKCKGRTNCDAAVAEAGNSARQSAVVGGIVTGIGSAALVGGIVWYFVQKPQQAAAAPRTFTADVVPALGPGYSGLAVSGSF